MNNLEFSERKGTAGCFIMLDDKLHHRKIGVAYW